MPGYQPSPHARQLDPSASPRALYGAELRHHRERMGLSQPALAQLLYVTPSFIANLETCRRRIHLDLAKQIDRVLKTDGFFTRNISAGRAPIPETLPSMTELEQHALTIHDWDAHLLPGLLQTPAYAQALTHTHIHRAATDEADTRHHEATRTRTHALDALANTPRYQVALSETAIRRPIGTTDVMDQQLHHLLTLANNGRITLTVLPLHAEPPSAPHSALRTITLPDHKTATHIQTHHTATLTSEPAAHALATLTWDLIHAAALPPDESLALIENTRTQLTAKREKNLRLAMTPHQL